MNKRFVVLSLLLLLCGAEAFAGSSVFNAAQYGALGDGKTLNTRAIQNLIDTCAARSGGTVVVPAGVYLTGALRLRSNVHLSLESGAILKGSDRHADYS